MSDIQLDEIRSGYNLSKINSNFNKLEDAVNKDLLNLSGGNNTMLQELDMNSNRMINLPSPKEPLDAVNLQHLNARLGSILDGKDSQDIDYRIWGDRYVGTFESGFTYTNDLDIARGQDGKYYRYIGSDPYPVAVAAGTIASDFNSFYRVEYLKETDTIVRATLSEINSGRFKVGDQLLISDRGDCPVVIVKGGSPDGYGSVDAGNGNSTLIIEKGECYLDWFGTRGDSVTDDSDAIQACLYYKYEKDISTPFTPTTQWTVRVRKGTYRYTRQIHQPSGVQLLGTNPIALQGLTSLDLETDVMTRFYADFPYEHVDYPAVGNRWTKKSSWVISGFSLNESQTGVPVGDLLDPYLHNMAGAIFDAGYYTRSFYNSIKGVMFYTDKNVVCGVAVGGHPNIQLDVTTHGFLTGSCVQSAWGSMMNLRGEAYHCGIMATTINATQLNNYLNKTSSVPSDVPAIGPETVPRQWQLSANTGYPVPDFYLSTGCYITFSTGLTIPVTTDEKWERGLVFWQSKVSVSTMYLEALTKLGFTAVSSDVVIDTLTANIVGADGVFKSNDSASVQILNFTNNEKVKISAGAGSSFPNPNNEVFVSNSENINQDEKFFGGLVIRTSKRQGEEAVYISSSGNDENTGLGVNNPVLTMGAAFGRAQFYGVSRVIIKDGETVSFTEAGATYKNLDITVEAQNSATVTCLMSGSNLSSHILQDSKVRFLRVNILVPESSGTPSTDFRGFFVPNGNVSITVEDGSILSSSINNGIFSTGAGKAAFLSLSLISSSLTADNMSVNGSTAGSGVKYIYNIDTLSTATGTQNWSSEFVAL